MPVSKRPKMSIDVTDRNGIRYILTVEGQITRDRALQIHDVMDLLSGGIQNETQALTNSNDVFPTKLSRFEKTQEIVQKFFSLIWFASKDVQLTYEQELKEPISLSTVSTYLARMANKGLIMRTGTGNNIKYKAAPNLQQEKINQQIQNKY